MKLDIKVKYNTVNYLVKNIENEELTTISRFLGDRIYNTDSYVMMLGETSSGKSTIINGLMQENSLFVSSAPSTGTITEVELKENITENELYAINKDATIERIDDDTFNKLLKEADNELQRLKLVTKSPKYNLNNMRIFDTPGYGSIIKEHEEVLKEFIPNSDVIIYTVNYRIGIQENDYSFLRFLKEIIREDVEIVLVINRCPASISNSDRRIVEIKKYISDILHDEIKTFFVKTEVTEDEYGYPLPKCEELWEYVESIINSPKRREMLENVFYEYIVDLLGKCENEIQKRYENSQLSKEMKDKIKERSNQFIENVENLIPSMIEPTFNNLISSIDNKLNIAKNNINDRVLNSIDKVSTANMDETISFVSNHLLPHSTEIETLEVKRYIEVTLEDLNDRVNDYLNTEIIEFNKDIELCFSTSTELAAKNMGKKIGVRALTGGLTKYFVKFGGRGGAGAGVANAASHALKVVGNVFNKKFKLATHNALKSTLKKIGATSVRAISNAAIVVIELATVIVEYSTWKTKLRNKSSKAINDWYKEARSLIKEDLLNLKGENIQTLKEIIVEEKSKYDYSEDIPDEKDTDELLKLLNKTKIELGLE